MLGSEVGDKSMENSGQEGDPEVRQRLALWLLNFLRNRDSDGQSVEPRHHVWLKRSLVTSTLLIVLLAMIWVGGNLFGARYELLGESLSARSSDAQIEAMLEEKVQAYRLSVIRPDGTQEEFKPQNIGLEVDVAKTVAEIRKQQNELKHRLQWWRPISARPMVHVDDKILDSFIDQHISVVIEPARDATISLTDGKVHIAEGAVGKQYGLANPERTIRSAVSDLRSEPLFMHKVELEPEITTADLADTKTKLESILSQSVELVIGDQKIHVEPRDIAAWIVLAPDPEHKDIKIEPNQVQIRTYVDRIAAEHSRPARAQVTLSSGGVIAGSPGIAVTSTDSAVAALATDVPRAEGLRVALSVKSAPFKTISAPTAGKWIEVDITNKRMYVYEESTLVRTFLVSAGKASTPTVTGTYTIYRKLPTRTMTGPGYSQPNVPWVNYFYRDYAIHGNYWRSARYFGNINSSHGCVGLRVADSAWLYGWAPIGTPVVIHT